MKIGLSERLKLLSLFVDVGILIVLDQLCVALHSESEEEEIWALNSLMELGMLRIKQGVEGRSSGDRRKEYLDLVKQMTDELSK